MGKLQPVATALSMRPCNSKYGNHLPYPYPVFYILVSYFTFNLQSISNSIGKQFAFTKFCERGFAYGYFNISIPASNLFQLSTFSRSGI